MLKNIFFKDMILVVWKYAKMHQNTFLTTPDGQKFLFEKKFLVVWKNAQMHQNTFLTNWDVKNIFLKDMILVGGVLMHLRTPTSRPPETFFQKRYFWPSGVVKNVFWFIFAHFQTTRIISLKKIFLNIWSG